MHNGMETGVVALQCCGIGVFKFGGYCRVLGVFGVLRCAVVGV